MRKKLIGTTLFLGLITIASAQSIPPQIQGQCINIQWVGTTLEASYLKNLYGWGGSEGGYQFSSLPNANYCIEFIQNIQGFLFCAMPDQPSPSPLYIPPSFAPR